MAQGLFEAFGRKGAAAAQVKGSVQASPASPKPTAWAGGSMASDSRNEARQKPITSPLEVIPLTESAYRRPLPQSEKAKSRRLRSRFFLGTGLVLFALFGVSAIYGSPLNWTFPAATKSQAIAGLSSAADVLKVDLERRSRAKARAMRSGPQQSRKWPLPPSPRRPQRFSTRISTIGLPSGSGRSTDGARSSLHMGAASMPNPRRRRSRNCFSPGRLPRRPARRSQMARPRTRKL